MSSAAVAPAQLTVAHVIHSLGAGGAEAVLVDLAHAAPSAGLRLIVVGLSDAHVATRVDNRVVPRLRELGVTVYELHAARYNPAAAVTLARLLRDQRVDIVHTHLKHADIVGATAARLAQVPSVSTLHVIDIPTTRAQKVRVNAAVLARRYLSGTVIALSSAQQSWYSRYAGAHAPVIVLPNGVVEPQVTRDRESIRTELKVPADAVMTVCVGLMRPEKGHSDLLEAIRQLPDDPRVVTAMAGDGPLLDNIRSSVGADPVLRERTRVLGFRRDIADLIAASDFVVQPSLEDALPTALISALAAGRPIVATNVGGIPDIVGTGCGLLVEAARPSALSAGIAQMATTIHRDAAVAETMRRAAREHYRRRFSADIWVRGLRAVYEQVIGARRRARRLFQRAGGPETAHMPIGEEEPSPRPRRIAMVEFPPSGGLFQFSLQLGEALARAGDNVELITGPSPELTSREPGCRVRSILPTWHPAAGSDAAELWRRARRILRAGQLAAAWIVLPVHLLRTRPDVVVWSEWRFLIDGMGVHLIRTILPNAVLAMVVHEPRPLVEQPGHDGMYKKSGTINRALAMAFTDLDVAFVLGESSKQALIETWPITASIHVIPHGDEGIFAPTAIPKAETTGPCALSFGTITAYKGIDTLCDAWPAVREHVPDAELIIAGAISADVDKSALHAQIERLAGVSLHIGYVPVKDVSTHFARARCVVLPYKRSSQSGVAHLAHTLRRPVIATRVGDIPAVVEDGVSGLLVDPDSPDALAAALVRLLTDPDLAQRMGNAGAQALATGASWDEVAARLREGIPAVRRR